MHSPDVFCPNPACPASGQVDQGNIRCHGKVRPRFKCQVCGKTFSARAGTPFFRRRTDEATITCVVTLVGHGCPIAAICAAFGMQAQTVREWVDASGAHCERLHREQILRERDLMQVQADEVRLKTQAGVVWMAMAVMVSTRLWLGGALSPHRDRQLIERLVALVVACASKGPLLFVTDGLKTYIDVVRRAFRSRQPGRRGRPRLVGWPELVIAQVVKQYEQHKVIGTVHRLISGSVQRFLSLLWSTEGCAVLNTAYIERLNGTFRSRLAPFGRRTRMLARREATLHRGMYLVGTLYNFCGVHTSLRSATGQHQTPAMAASISDHVWSVDELLHYRVPPPRWVPPVRRGRRSRAFQALIDRWCPLHR